MCSAVEQNGARGERIRADLLLVWIRMVDLAGNKTVPPRLGPPAPFKLVSLSTATNKKNKPGAQVAVPWNTMIYAREK